MTNHVTPDGLLAVDECDRTIRLRSSQGATRIILQDTCTAEPRVDLFVMDNDGDSANVTLDVVRATALYKALDAFLKDSRGQSGWQYGGVVYDLDKAWEGRPGTGLEGKWFRHIGTFRDSMPLMSLVDVDPTQSYTCLVWTMADVLGLQPCSMHGIYASPCYACELGFEAGRTQMWPEDGQ
jgi:hypothetical protein